MTTPPFEFKPWPKIPRLNRDIIITEKIDGTNASVLVTDEGIYAASRTRWITPEADNYGFAKWVSENAEELIKLGPGQHFGEWWGQGVQRGYDQKQKWFSLFNVSKWTAINAEPFTLPECCRTVPVLYCGPFCTSQISEALTKLRCNGSYAAPGFMRPEGIVVFHTAAQHGFKITLENDDKSKHEKT